MGTGKPKQRPVPSPSEYACGYDPTDPLAVRVMDYAWIGLVVLTFPIWCVPLALILLLAGVGVAAKRVHELIRATSNTPTPTQGE